MSHRVPRNMHIIFTVITCLKSLETNLEFKSCTQAMTLKVRPWPSQNLRKEGLPYMAFNASGKTNQVALMHLRLEYLKQL